MSAEKALLAGLALPGREMEAEASQEELARLAESAGAEVVGRSLQARAAPDPATYIGSGKVRMLKEQALALGAVKLIFLATVQPKRHCNGAYFQLKEGVSSSPPSSAASAWDAFTIFSCSG